MTKKTEITKFNRYSKKAQPIDSLVTFSEENTDAYFTPIEEVTMSEHESTLSLVQQALLNVLPRASRAKSHLAYLTSEDWTEVHQASKSKVATLKGLYQALEAQFTLSQASFYANYKQFYVHYTRARKLLNL
jgi:hypothetical protein